MDGLMQDVGLTLHMVLDRVATLYPDKVVATKTADGVRRRTYAEVVGRVTRLAAALDELGIEPGDRVATFAWNSDRHLELYLAVPCMGAVLHTLNPRLHPDQVRWIINHAEDQAIFYDASLEGALGAVGDTETVKHLVRMNDLDDDSAGSLQGATDYERLLHAAPAQFAWPQVDERAAAAMCYTSGTTGDPKGVVYSHRSSVLHSMAALFADFTALSERDVCLPVVPQFHANAWGTPYSAMFTGASLAMPGRFMADPASIAALTESEGVTMSAAVPTVWFGVLQAIRAGEVRAESLRTLDRILCGGSAVPESLMRGYDELGIRIVHAWGMTETSPLATVANLKSTVPHDHALRTRLTQGIPAPGLKLRLETDRGDIAPWDGETMGELQITGPWIADAYYDPDAADNRGGLDRFTDDEHGNRWLRTGDVAVIDGQGYVRLVDRTKDLVKSGGEWISTLALENLLLAHPRITEAAVIAVPHPKWDERPLACVVRSDDSLTGDEVRSYLGEHVARWQVPDDVVFIDEVPKTSVGKFDKKVLRDTFAGHQLPSSS